MLKLDHAGIDYLIEVAEQIGFKANSMETSQDAYGFPSITITFEQIRTVDPSAKELELDFRKGVTEKQTADIAAKGKATLLDGSQI